MIADVARPAALSDQAGDLGAWQARHLLNEPLGRAHRVVERYGTLAATPGVFHTRIALRGRRELYLLVPHGGNRPRTEKG